MENLLFVATQVGVLFSLMAVGALCRKLRLLDEASVKGVVNVLVLVVTPCLIVDCFQRPFDPSSLRALALAFAIAFAAHLAVIAFATVAVRHRDPGTRTVLKLSAVFSNAGFMGIPLEHALFGADGVFFGIVYVVVFNLFMWSWGLCVMKGESLKTMDARSAVPLFLNPGTVGILVALPLFIFSVKLPAVPAECIRLVSSLNTPLAMLVIGYYLAGASLMSVLRSPCAHFAAFVRLVAYPAALIAALLPFKGSIDRTMALSLVTAASAPVAAMVTMFASKYGRDVDMSVGLVSGTTLLSMFTMPVAVSVAMAVF